jgi:hypothetical protein
MLEARQSRVDGGQMAEPIGARLAEAFFRVWTTPLSNVVLDPLPPAVGRVLKRAISEWVGVEPERTIDQRIAQIEAARANLVDALKTVDDLQKAANDHKLELENVARRLEATHAQKSEAEVELANLKQLAQSDLETFRKVAGIPSRREVAKERFIGFVLGVSASLLASAIWWAVSALVAKHS